MMLLIWLIDWDVLLADCCVCGFGFVCREVNSVFFIYICVMVDTVLLFLSCIWRLFIFVFVVDGFWVLCWGSLSFEPCNG